MFNFSKIVRFLKEDPYADGTPNEEIPARGRIRDRLSRPARDTSHGGLGFWAEKVIAQHVLPRFKPGNYKNIDVGQGKSTAAKTDIYLDKGGDPSENTAYSVKSKLDNDFPQKIHQTGVGNTSGSKSKFKMNGANPKALDAWRMYLGLGRTPEEEGNFTTSQELYDNYRENYDELMKHLEFYKKEIFNALVRQQGGFGDGAYSRFDPRMIDALISHRVTGENNSGPIDIRQFEGNVDDEKFKNLTWRHDGKRFYLGDMDDAPTDQRMLDIWPIDKEGSSWSNREDDGGPRPGQRGFVRGKREKGLAEPGAFKATMATNPEFLDKYFPKIAEYMLDDDGETLSLEDVFQKSTEPTIEPPEQPRQGLNFSGLMGRMRQNEPSSQGESDIPDVMDSGNSSRIDKDRRKQLEDAIKWIRQGQDGDNAVERKAAKQLLQIYNGILRYEGRFGSKFLDDALDKFYGE